MTFDVFRKRIEQGKPVDHTYVDHTYEVGGRSGLIALWRHNGRIVLTWEECPDGEMFDESTYSRDERRDFGSIEEAVGYLRQERVDISTW